MWDNQISRHHAQLVEHVTSYDGNVASTLNSFAAQGIPPEQSLALLDRTVNAQAVVMATTDYFAWAMPFFVLLIVLIWFAKPVKAVMPAGGGGH